MSVALLAAFVGASALLLLMPGPNVALIVASSVAHGPRYGLLTVAGTSAAMVVQLAVAVFGMAALLAFLSAWFEWLRWLGVAYLLYLAVRAWRAPVAAPMAAPGPRLATATVLRGFLVSLTNPKTLLFYGAFLPQFVVPGPDATAQLAVLAAIFIVLALAIDGGWALLAARARGLLLASGRWRNRVTAALLTAAGAGLALARRS